MKKYGFECEYWVETGAGGSLILVPKSLPMDECGYLAEVRGKPDADPLDAAHLMLAEEERLRIRCAALATQQCTITTTNPTRRLEAAFKREALRAYGKNPREATRGNIYGKDYPVKDPWSRAGLHVHFSDSTLVEFSLSGALCANCNYTHTERVSREVPQQQDIARIVRALDVAFAPAITAAKRVPGMYELKLHGFEYRSLPADTSPVQVARVILDHKL